MNIAFSNLSGFPVKTQSGEDVGKITDCVIDRKAHAVTHYEVKMGHLTNRTTRLIHTSQVIGISETEMIVKDGLVSEEVKEKRRKNPPIPQGVSPTKL